MLTNDQKGSLERGKPGGGHEVPYCTDVGRAPSVTHHSIAARACSLHRCSLTPNRRSNTINAAAPRMLGGATYMNGRYPSGGSRKLSQPMPATTDSPPRARGKKV